MPTTDLDRAKPRAPFTDGSVAAAATLAADWTDVRDIRIRRDRADGRSARQIAADAGLSHTQVLKICAREPAVG